MKEKQKQCVRIEYIHHELLNIKWQDRTPDTEVLAKATLPSIFTILMQSQLRWAGHVACMPDHRLPKRLFYGELQQGKRSHGGQKKRFRDTLKISLKAFYINPDSWEKSAVDRDKWRAAVHKGAKLCEANRTAAAVQKRQARKSRTLHRQQVTKPHYTTYCHVGSEGDNYVSKKRGLGYPARTVDMEEERTRVPSSHRGYGRRED
ncbi:uncharacterized protein LOC143297468 [Babylonia areolata]|uniref:uncharacterized protein LOC143297468 n=1 Tax=Babylonia areolata TaxID=304850 RepID=UPI003FD5B343